MKRINNVDDIVAKSVLREVNKIDSNKDFLDAIRNGVNLKDPATGLFRDYKIVDFDTPENNQFVVTNQFYFEGDTENIRPDILIFVNGLPLVDVRVFSLRSPHIGDYLLRSKIKILARLYISHRIRHITAPEPHTHIGNNFLSYLGSVTTGLF